MCTNCMVDVVTSGAYEGDDSLNSDSDGDGKQFRQVQRVKPELSMNFQYQVRQTQGRRI